MATTLKGKIIRQSTIQIDGREIIIILNADQTISLKLKGMKSGTLTIPIKKLYDQLKGTPVKQEEDDPAIVMIKGEPMISVNRLRSLNNVTPSGLDVTIKIDELIRELLGKK